MFNILISVLSRYLSAQAGFGADHLGIERLTFFLCAFAAVGYRYNVGNDKHQRQDNEGREVIGEDGRSVSEYLGPYGRADDQQKDGTEDAGITAHHCSARGQPFQKRTAPG